MGKDTTDQRCLYRRARKALEGVVDAGVKYVDERVTRRSGKSQSTNDGL